MFQLMNIKMGRTGVISLQQSRPWKKHTRFFILVFFISGKLSTHIHECTTHSPHL